MPMPGYSGTPLVQKLGIKAGSRLLLMNAPQGFEGALAPMPEGVTVVMRAGKQGAQVIVLFCDNLRAFEATFDAAKRALDESGGLWVAWPKKASGVKTDLTENIVRDLALAAGLVDNKVCAIDEVWSGLRLVVRVKDRKGGK
jgi:hypothetical protein